jgi:hypothetical protein
LLDVVIMIEYIGNGNWCISLWHHIYQQNQQCGPTDDTVLNSSIILHVIVASYISFEPAVWHPVLKEIQTDVVHQLGILEKHKNNKGRRLKDCTYDPVSKICISKL